MKTRIRNQNKKRGIVLVTTLATILVLAIIVASYLTLANNQKVSVARSQGWNQAISVLESGIEESLTQLHYAGTNSMLLLSNGWTYGADGLYHKTRTFSDGSYFNATIQVTNLPVIVSTGYVPFMYRSSSTSTNYVSRRVRVVGQMHTNVAGGLNAKGQITISGGNTFVDSFNSSDPNHSTGGLYDPTKRKDNGRALTDSGAAGAISLGGGNIYGTAVTGPTGTVSIGNGAIGDLAWDSSSSGVEPGHLGNDANVQFNDVVAPFTYGTGFTPGSGSYGGTNYTYLIGSGNYNMSSLSLSSSSVLAVNGNAVLYINGSVSLTGQSTIYILPGGSLTLYLNGNASIAGGGIYNDAALASKCAIYGMPGCTSLSYTGQAAFVGMVDAPDAAFSLTGQADASGSFTASSISMSGLAAVHFDEALATAATDYVVQSWNEF